MTALIIIGCIVVVLILAFLIWFFSYRAKGNCPLCAMKKICLPTKLTIDIKDEPQYDNNAAKTPPMGWSSWNTFRQNISEELICETAEAMKKSGLYDAGYRYVNIDDCWQSSLRDEEGRLQADLEKFPSGMAQTVAKVNRMGLKVGIYSSNGTLTCEDMPASLGKEELDAQTVAQWGCEFFKYDFCHHKFISGVAPVIEALDISKPGESAKIELLPKQAKLTGRAHVVKLNKKKAIGRLNHGAGTATFTFEVEEAGSYILTFRYLKTKAKKDKYLLLKVNGKEYEATFPATSAPSPTGRAQIEIELQQGTNQIVLSNPVVTMADSSYMQYKRMGRALEEGVDKAAKKRGDIKKPIVYSICEWGWNIPYKWGAKAGNMWRTTPDISANWVSINGIYKHNIKLYKYASPGAWNDPDMLEVGNGKLTREENRTHFALWCMMAAPLVLGNDIRKFVDEDGSAVVDPVLEVVTNRELIKIDQDVLGKSAKIVKQERGVDILARPLENGDVALCFYNTKKSDRGLTFDLRELPQDEYLNMEVFGGDYAVTSVWSGEKYLTKTISVSLAPHGSQVYRISTK